MMAALGLFQSFYSLTPWIWKSDLKEHNVLLNIGFHFSKTGHCASCREELFIYRLFVLFKNSAFVVYNAVK